MIRVYFILLLAACHAHAPPAILRPPGAREPTITWRRVETAAAMPAAPQPGTYQIHLIDVGTGLAIFVRGADFSLLYDAGTNDRDERPRRVVDYLTAALGPSGDELCGSAEPTAPRPLAHVVLSHPHLDHASALDLVFHCFAVGTFWDAGRTADTVFYRELIAGLARIPGVRYRTAADVPPTRARRLRDHDIGLEQTDWRRFSDGDVVELGAGARFTVLHADGKQQRDVNQNSIVLAVELGAARLLLVGDAESGERRDPTYPPGDVEAYLLDHHARALRVDILQVGHHGSKTSSRRAFLEAVHPRLALISSGPKRYGRVTLPDREVLDELRRIGATILRTDARDAACPVRGRIGGDRGPGGCDAWVIEIAP